MKKISIILIAALIAMSLSSCGASSDKIVLNVYNWGEYIDETVLDDFESKYPNIKINYETYPENETMYTKITSGNSYYDILIPSDYMISRLIDENLLYKLDFNNIPNYSLIDDKYKDMAFDPKNEYSVPYMWGMLGILYDKTKVHEKEFSWDILFSEKYSKQILMKNDMRDALGVALCTLGYSVNSTNPDEINKAKEKLISQKDVILGRVGDEGMDKMIAGEAAIALMYSGDAAYCISENPDLAFAYPKESANLFFDSMVIPKTAEHKKEAELFINFMCETEAALKNTLCIGYSTPQIEAREQLPDEVKNSFAYPSAERLKNTEVYIYLKDKTELYDNAWTEYIASF